MSEDTETLKTLDAAVRAHAEHLVGEGEMVTDWIVVLGTRRFDGGGLVRHVVSDDGLPVYVARGMFHESLVKLDRDQGDTDD